MSIVSHRRTTTQPDATSPVPAQGAKGFKSPFANTAELSIRTYRRLVGALLVTQTAVLVVVINTGWYNTDDLALLMQASHRGLSWDYLRMSINDHLLPGLRAEFWALRHSFPLNFGLTVGARVILQVLGTALLVLVLTTLAGRRRRILVAASLYAFCPLVLTNSLWLVVALSLSSAQVFVLAAMYTHVRASVTGSLRWAAATGLLLLGGALFWEKVAITALLLPVLSLGYLHEGTLRNRVAAVLRQWRLWLLTILPIAGFTGYFVVAGYGGAASSVKPSQLAHVLWLQWSRVVSPSMLGGPWRWLEMPHVLLGYATARPAEVVLMQLAVVAVAVVGVRLLGRRSLIAWAFPIIPLIVGTSLVAAGRLAVFGELIATTLRYGADLAAPFFLGVALAITPTSVTEIKRRLQPHAAAEPSTEAASTLTARPRRLTARGAVAAAAALWLVGSLASVAHFARAWGRNPTEAYVTTLTSNVDAAGPSLNLYDTLVSQDVLPIFFGPHWHLSDLLPLTGRHPVFDGPATEPLLADERGRLVPAVLVPSAVRIPPTGGLCAYLIQGAGTFRIPFDVPAPEGDGFLRIDYLQSRPSTAVVRVEDTQGQVRDTIPGGRVGFDYQLSNVTLRLPITSVAAVVVTTGAPETHLCIGKLTVGAPFPVQGAK